VTGADGTFNSGQVARLVQLTDCHLGPDSHYMLAGIHTHDSFRAVLAALRGSHVAADLIMVTGDIAAHGSPDAYRAFLGEMSALPFRWLPGNHDDFALMNSLDAEAFAACQSIGNWRLLSLNTAVPDRVGGSLDQQQLQWLDETLAEDSISPAIIFMHHPPMDIGCRWLDRQQVANGVELASVLRGRDQVKAIVTGHVHQDVSRCFAGIQLYTTPSTCFQFAPAREEFGLDSLPPGYRWLNLYRDGSLETGVVLLEDYPESVDVGVQGY
jgi:3',5'-cyclic-AMP phosphodiesterase